MIWIGGLTFRELRGNAAARAPSDEGQSRHFLRGSINCSRDVGTQIREPHSPLYVTWSQKFSVLISLVCSSALV